MTHRLTTNYAKNYCNRTLIVKVIIENVVTCFLGGHSVLLITYWTILLRHFCINYSCISFSNKLTIKLTLLIFSTTQELLLTVSLSSLTATWAECSSPRSDWYEEVWRRLDAAGAWHPLLTWRVWVIILTRRCLIGTAPRYLGADCVLVSEVAQRRHLRSATGHQLVWTRVAFERFSYTVRDCGTLPRMLRDTAHNTT